MSPALRKRIDPFSQSAPAVNILGTSLLGLACLAAVWPCAAGAEPKTVCTITINSPDERETFRRYLPPDRYRVVELVEHGRPDWLAAACRRGVACDALIVSGHFDAGTEFYSDRFDHREFLTVAEMERASCSASCSGLFSHLKEVYLFGCNTLKAEPVHVASAEIARSLVRSGRTPEEAERLSAALTDRYGQSNRERMRQVFKGTPVLYGFSAQAPLGRVAGPLLDRYFQSAPKGETASGRVSPTFVELFAGHSIAVAAGLTDADPNARLRRDVCSLADDQPSEAEKIASMHGLLRRDMTEVRMLLDRIERFTASVGPAQRQAPGAQAALDAIATDRVTRGRYLEFARDVDEAAVQMRLMALARALGWLTPAQEREEFLRMISQRMARDTVGPTEIDLVCASDLSREAGLAPRLMAMGDADGVKLTHSLVLACLGDVQAHARVVRALTSASDDEVALAQVYLRHRALADIGEQRAVAAGIARMPAGSAQVRALETLARQQVTDPESVRDIARLFPLARSLDVQRAIAGVLLHADLQALPKADLARTLRQHRLASRDGGDVIDVLIRLLQAG